MQPRRHLLAWILRALLAGIFWGWVAAAPAGSAAFGAERLTARLVEASNTGDGTDASLRDIQRLLGSNLPFKDFHLVDQSTMRLPAEGVVPLRGGFLLRCHGIADRLAVTFERDGKVLIQTELALSSGRPVVLGGFPCPRGKLLLVLTVR